MCFDCRAGVRPFGKKHPGLTLKRMDELLAKHVYKHYRNWCKRYGKNVSACCHRFSCQRFGKDTWGTPAELNSVYKAAVVKSMMYWAAAFLREEDNGVSGGPLRICTTHAFAKFQHLIDTNGPFFTPEVSSQVVFIARKGLLLYQKIASQDGKRTDERKNYKIIPKFHSLLEMTFYIEQTHRNPRSLTHTSIFLVFGNVKIGELKKMLPTIQLVQRSFLLPTALEGSNTAIKMKTL